MKTIGLIGGMSWESTVVYYQLINRMVREAQGGLHSAKLILWSFDFADIESLQAKADWTTATGQLCDAARRLETAGADCILICTNTMHKMAPQVQEAIEIPLLHIADATADAIRYDGLKSPLLLATRYTMEEDFYTGRLQTTQGLDVITPAKQDRDIVHQVIYDELCQGIIKPASKQQYLDIVASNASADCIILGCTEVGLLIGAQDFDRPVFDTTELHARAAVSFALK